MLITAQSGGTFSQITWPGADKSGVGEDGGSESGHVDRQQIGQVARVNKVWGATAGEATQLCSRHLSELGFATAMSSPTTETTDFRPTYPIKSQAPLTQT